MEWICYRSVSRAFFLLQHLLKPSICKGSWNTSRLKKFFPPFLQIFFSKNGANPVFVPLGWKFFLLSQSLHIKHTLFFCSFVHFISYTKLKKHSTSYFITIDNTLFLHLLPNTIFYKFGSHTSYYYTNCFLNAVYLNTASQTFFSIYLY